MVPQTHERGPSRRAGRAATTAAATTASATTAVAVGLVGLGTRPPLGTSSTGASMGTADFGSANGNWSSYGPAGTSTALVDGRLCSVVPGGTAEPSDAAVQLDGVTLEAGQTYTLTFMASATIDTTITLQIGGSWPDVFHATSALTATPQTFTSTFTPEWTATPGTIASRAPSLPGQ